MAAFFITSTGTDIGKTFVTAGLIRTLKRRKTAVRALKPVLSGFAMKDAAASDAGRLLTALDEDITPESVDRIAPWRFSAPLSPDMAAEKEGRNVDFADLTEFCEDFAAGDGIRLIEGVGGVMVPLDARHLVVDLISDLEIPAILVAGTSLGTISYILTAAAVLAREGVKIAALVLHESAENDVAIPDTVRTLQRFLPGVPVIVSPRIPREEDADLPELADIVTKAAR